MGGAIGWASAEIAFQERNIFTGRFGGQLSTATGVGLDIPGEFLALMGIPIVSAVSRLTIRSMKDDNRGQHIGKRVGERHLQVPELHHHSWAC